MKIWEGLTAKTADHQELAFSWIEDHLPTAGPSKNQGQRGISMSIARFPLAEGLADHNIICEGLNQRLGGKGVEKVINKDEKEDWGEGGALSHTHGQRLGDGGGAHTKRSLTTSEECTDPAHQTQRDISSREVVEQASVSKPYRRRSGCQGKEALSCGEPSWSDLLHGRSSRGPTQCCECGGTQTGGQRAGAESRGRR